MTKEKCLVTGCAGFIGSHLAEKLINLGYEVIGVDAFCDSYSPAIKRRNLANLLSSKSKKFTLLEQDLNKINLKKILEGVDYIFHQAASAGVRKSWGADFDLYVKNNIFATQKLLEAAKNKPLKKIVFASSSSVYGDSPLPMKETNVLKPLSPYGVTKLASENLCYLYWKNYKLPVINLRYFTVYGPRQRPDMSLFLFIKGILQNREIVVYGDGKQTRDFTYISDVIQANLLAMQCPRLGECFNIGGGTQMAINKVIGLVEKLIGRKARIRYADVQQGDVEHTLADTLKAQKILRFQPQFDFNQGLNEEIKWLQKLV